MPDARSLLIAIINHKMADLNQHKERLTQNLDQFKAGFAASHACYGMLNQKLMVKAALLQRYRTQALIRFEKLESKLHQKTETKSGYSGSSQPLIKATFRPFSSTVFSNVGSHRMTYKHKPMNPMSLYRNYQTGRQAMSKPRPVSPPGSIRKVENSLINGQIVTLKINYGIGG